jgi:alkanesulfonate monooxygenase SsuD/methylene tetrahydromethanopterin reductase-like flavin-dependent oxidoreductase (luciferase family)
MGTLMCGDGYGLDPSGIPKSVPSVIGGVAVEKLAPVASSRYADPIMIFWNRREIADRNREVARVAAAANVGNDTVFVIVAIDPSEAGRLAIELVKRRGRNV